MCLLALFAPILVLAAHPLGLYAHLNEQEKQWITQNPVIRVGIDRAFPPFGFVTEENQYKGFTADVLSLIATRLGIKLEILKDTAWNDTIQLAQQGDIDLIAGIVNTADRQHYLHFTPSYIETPTIIINDGLKNGYIGQLKNLHNKRVAVEKGSFASDVLAKDHPQIIQVAVQNTEVALGLVAAGRADAYIGNAVAASFLIKELGLSSLFFSGQTPYSSNHSLGITKPNPLLASIMSKTLASIDQHTKDTLATKWFGMQVYPHISQSTALTLAGLSCLLLALAGTWIYTLHRARKALHLSERTVRYQANVDSLTGLINRRYLYTILTDECSRPTDSQQHFALLFLDLDQFKEVNDTLGHNIGDELLKRVAKRLRNCVRADDLVGRLGGDEFTIILYDVQETKDLARIATTICNSLSNEFRVQGHSINVSTSIGITRFPQDAWSADEILINADQAMYACKNNGSNGFCFFNEHMREAMIQRSQTLRDLRFAIEAKQLELYYQPIMNLRTGEITKAEALIRWNHPEKGMISPATFIQLAEESGLIHEIGEWIFKQAAKQVTLWRQEYSPTLQISINTSPLQYKEHGIDIKRWSNYLNQLGLAGQALIMEITEGLLMESNTSVKSKLLHMRDVGIEVAIDDFGTGYSSLSYLKKFDIDYLKIDQSFVANLTADSEDLALCEAITVMAHKLGCKVVAEGIETQEQRTLLQDADCDYGQGYLFSKPLAAGDFTRLLEQLGGSRTQQAGTLLK